MPRIFITLLLSAGLITILCAQSGQSGLTVLQDKYKSFDYSGVIKSGDLMLNSGNLSRGDSLEIFRLQGLSYYSLADMPGALRCFISILRISPNYQLQPRDNPPKVIDFFNEIRLDLIKPVPVSGGMQDSITVLHRSQNPVPTRAAAQSSVLNRAIGYSLLLPGLGHIHCGDTPKGWILLGSGLVSLSSAIFFTIDADRKQNLYLAATIKKDIEAKYADYNQAYKIRNASIIIYTSLWIYTQLDLLYWSKPYQKNISLHPAYNRTGLACFTLQVNF
jgi:hypothetical protein